MERKNKEFFIFFPDFNGDCFFMQRKYLGGCLKEFRSMKLLEITSFQGRKRIVKVESIVFSGDSDRFSKSKPLKYVFGRVIEQKKT